MGLNNAYLVGAVEPGGGILMSTTRRVVIVGAGFAGATCARKLERRLRGREDVEVLLIDRNNFFVFTPLLVEAGTGSLQPRHAVVPVRDFLNRGRFLMAEVTAVEPDARRVRYRLGGEGEELALGYDQLVLAQGSVTRMPPVPGLAEHGFGMKRLGDAVALRDRALRLLEIADATEDPQRRRELLQLVVVGGNFTGVEVAGEYLAFLRRAARRTPNVEPRDCGVTLVELSDRVLGALGEELSRYAGEQLRREGVHIELERSAGAIHADRVELDDGRVIPTRTTIWCAGIAAPPPLWDGALPTDDSGWLLTDPDLRVRGWREVWGIGDAAVNVDAEGHTLPATAQSAVQEGEQLAANLAAVLRGEEARPLRYRSRGALAALGCRSGVAEVFGFKLSGFWAWFLWRSVYLAKMPGFGRRLRVALDWTLDLLLGRDTVALGLHGPPPSDRRQHAEGEGGPPEPGRGADGMRSKETT